jgi:23S rRNA (uracil1939-C5)-methyltransferase
MDVSIEKLIYGGDGLAHHEGATLFVPFVLPGEKVAAEAVEKSKKFMRCRLEHVEVASAERVEARCPHFGVCGGCNYQHIPYEAQLRYKAEILRETLRRIGKIDWTGEIVQHAFEPWEYRNRAQWKVRSVGERGGGVVAGRANQPMDIGYFQAGSNNFMPAYSCPILAPELFATLNTLRQLLKEGLLPPTLREVEAFAAGPDSLLMALNFSKFPANRPQLRETLFAGVRGLTSTLIQDEWHQRMELFGPGSISYAAAGFQYRVSHLSFFQVNRFAIEEMCGTVAELAGEGALALDLFCGVGLFSLPLARKFDQVIGVESNPAAVRDLQFNAALAAQGLRGKIESREADAETFLRGFRGRAHCVVLDPPRAGLEKEAAERLLKARPRRIVYVSCDPATMARDLALLGSVYSLSVVHAFDLFPQTFHLETIAGLVRRE